MMDLSGGPLTARLTLAIISSEYLKLISCHDVIHQFQLLLTLLSSHHVHPTAETRIGIERRHDPVQGFALMSALIYASLIP